MPALPAVPGGIRTVLTLTTGTDTLTINRLFFFYNGAGGTAAQLDTFCAQVGTAWNGQLAQEFTGDRQLTAVDAEDLTSSTSPVGHAGMLHLGTRPQNSLPAGTACVVRFHVARRYRGGHPRAYLACFGTTDLANPQTWSAAVTATFLTQWQAFITACLSALVPYGGATPAHVNVSYYEGFENVTLPSGRQKSVPKLRPTPVVDLVTAYSVNPHIGSQRRRNQTP
jgi:hypothetical protein